MLLYLFFFSFYLSTGAFPLVPKTLDSQILLFLSLVKAANHNKDFATISG